MLSVPALICHRLSRMSAQPILYPCSCLPNEFRSGDLQGPSVFSAVSAAHQGGHIFQGRHYGIHSGRHTGR